MWLCFQVGQMMENETMETSTWQLQHAKNRFSEVVDRAVSGTPQWVTRHGKPAVCVVSAADYQALIGREGRGVKEVLLGSPHPEVDLDFTRDKSVGREVEL